MSAITANSRSGPIRSIGPIRPGIVATVVYDGLALFEFAVASDIFDYSYPDELGVPWYRFVVCGSGPSVRFDNGLQMNVPHGLAMLGRADTVLVPPCNSPDGVPDDVLRALRRAHARGARLVSLCTGAFILAAAGLLDGRRATTHWAECDDFRDRYPLVRLDPDVLYVDDGDILTSAGSAASIDLCLHIVRQDYGAEVASRLARQMVVPPYRDGGQAQYIERPLPPVDDSDLFADTISWAQQHLDEPITIEVLARRSAMSRRSFARHFAAATGTTPYQWLLRLRIQLAQRLLETTDLSIESVAQNSGFINAGNLRKQFGRAAKTTPNAYRRTFQSRSAS